MLVLPPSQEALKAGELSFEKDVEHHKFSEQFNDVELLPNSFTSLFEDASLALVILGSDVGAAFELVRDFELLESESSLEGVVSSLRHALYA